MSRLKQSLPLAEILPRVRRATGIVIIAVACLVMVAWMAHAEVLRAMVAPLGTMVFNTALCLALLGSGILMLDGKQWQNKALIMLGAVVTTLAVLTLIEHLAKTSFGIDLQKLHGWMQVGAPSPGRMAIGTSVATLLLGAALILWPLAARGRVGWGIQCLVLLSMLVAIFGIIIRQLDLEYMYSRYVLSGMALHTAFGVVATGAGFWTAWQAAPWNRLFRFHAGTDRIISMGTTILLVIALSAGLVGLYATDQAIDESTRDSQMQGLRAREQLFATVIELRMVNASTLATRSEIGRRLRQINSDSQDTEAKLRLTELADNWLPAGFSGVAFYGVDGAEAARAGHFVEKPIQMLPLGTEKHRSSLLWSDGFYLRVERDIFNDGQLVGKALIEQPAPHLTEALLEIKTFSESGEVELCGRVKGQASCFPTRLNSKPYEYPLPAKNQPYLIYHALDGEAGIGYGRDYRGIRVLAAYAPIADYGMGLVVKSSVEEVSGPVRRQLEKMLPVVLMFVILGIALLNYLVHPLTKNLSRSQQQLKLALDNSQLALWDWDTRSGRVYLSEQWQEILGGEAAVTHIDFRALQELVHPDDREGLVAKLRDSLKSNATYEVEHRVKTYNGDWKWIHSMGKVVERDKAGRALRMTGTNADISQRKKAEEGLAYQAQHDALTGLPNRVLFYDRLGSAMARSRRASTLMAVMYLDIDKFKSVNDSLGHAMGDALLKEFSRRLQSCMRNVDTVARLGGDEYAVVLEELGSKEDGYKIAEKIVVSMRPEFTLEYRTLSITTSVGIAFYQGEKDVSADDLLKRADKALYAAKGAGRNNYQIAE